MHPWWIMRLGCELRLCVLCCQAVVSFNKVVVLVNKIELYMGGGILLWLLLLCALQHRLPGLLSRGTYCLDGNVYVCICECVLCVYVCVCGRIV